MAAMRVAAFSTVIGLLFVAGGALASVRAGRLGARLQPKFGTRNVRLVHPWYFEPPHVDSFVVIAGPLDRALTCGSPS